jgi:hypothetical protein
MSATKLDNDLYYISTNWENETITKNSLKSGWYNCGFTNIDSTIKDDLDAGSTSNMNGDIYEYSTDEVFSGTELAGVNYLYHNGTGVSINQTSPTYDYSKKGWYNVTSRCIFQFDYAGIVYDNKHLVSDQSMRAYNIMRAIEDMKADITAFLT